MSERGVCWGLSAAAPSRMCTLGTTRRRGASKRAPTVSPFSPRWPSPCWPRGAGARPTAGPPPPSPFRRCPPLRPAPWARERLRGHRWGGSASCERASKRRKRALPSTNARSAAARALAPRRRPARGVPEVCLPCGRAKSWQEGTGGPLAHARVRPLSFARTCTLASCATWQCSGQTHTAAGQPPPLARPCAAAWASTGSRGPRAPRGRRRAAAQRERAASPQAPRRPRRRCCRCCRRRRRRAAAVRRGPPPSRGPKARRRPSCEAVWLTSARRS